MFARSNKNQMSLEEAARLSELVLKIIKSCESVDQLSVAEKLATVVVDDCKQRQSPVTFNFRNSLAAQRQRIMLVHSDPVAVLVTPPLSPMGGTFHAD